MKNLFIVGIISMFLFSCSNQQKKQEETASGNTVNAETEVYTIDELYEKAGSLSGQEVVVKGMVMHVCKHGGERCFLMGSNEDINIRVEAGEKIGAFGQEMMGSDLVITGVLKEVKTEADAHNPGKEHGIGESEEDAETDGAHQVIAQAQEAAETVYFIEGIKLNKEL
ncbi:MAG TPA: hypothetical protein VKA10_11460 [Prolixibacteraceae bacterium]|nr:hypothetical protein [Prolixibacteraceae bacterium]